MVDWLTRTQRSRNMSSIRSTRNRSTEQAFLTVLRNQHISGWRRHLRLPGKPDFAFPSQKVLVFIDGCFWHGCPKCYRLPEDNRDYWIEKLNRNRRRDRKVDAHAYKWMSECQTKHKCIHNPDCPFSDEL